jgi:TonB family protein
MMLFEEWAWKSTAILGVAWVVTLLLRRHSAALRHRVWALALAGLLVAPVISLKLPAWHSRLAPVLPGSRVVATLPETAVALERAPTPRTPWELIVWGAGFSLLLARLASGIAWVQRRARPSRDESGGGLARELSIAFGVRRAVTMLSLGQTTMPMTWGFLRPCIVLPADFESWSEERRRIVISHELAHIGRGDWGWQICAEIVKAVYWFHPLVWLAARRLRQESEVACDDAVLNSGVLAADYASELLKLSRMLKNSAWLDAPALAMARTSDLERRFTSMLNPLLNRRRMSRRAQIILAAAALAVLIPIASLRAQGGKLTGTVYDPDTAIIVNATVVATNVVSHVAQTTTTNAGGKFSFTGLPAGTYDVRASHPGFAIYRNPEFTVGDGRDTTLDVKLALGGVTQTIQVIGKGVAAPSAGNEALGPRRILVGGNVQATKLIRQVKPPYPEEARAAGVQGAVELSAVIAADGRLAAIRVVKSLGYGLDEAAMSAVSQWRYEPTLLNGRPVEVTTNISVEFKLAPGN